MESTVPDTNHRRNAGLTALAALGLMAWFAVRMRAGESAVADRLPRLLRPTVHFTIATTERHTLGPTQYAHWDFQLPARVCTVHGRIDGAPGARNDFYAAVMGDADFRKFAVDYDGQVLWQSAPATVAANVETAIRGPGLFHLVVSNHFSATATKTVTATASILCP